MVLLIWMRSTAFHQLGMAVCQITEQIMFHFDYAWWIQFSYIVFKWGSVICLSFVNGSFIQVITYRLSELGNTNRIVYFLQSVPQCMPWCDVTDAFAAALWCHQQGRKQPFHWLQNSCYSWLGRSHMCYINILQLPSKWMHCERPWVLYMLSFHINFSLTRASCLLLNRRCPCA